MAMLKTKTPRYNTATNTRSTASTHLWEDFVKQVGSYARRNNIAHKGSPVSERIVGHVAPPPIWYNQSTPVR
ncbi:MAG: hypothetical protein K2X81_11990 [Candidatus Obscuribacterales bacterium]|nr:hypothetical protein [Candidatus Obscuribacterales bacterium]